MFAVFPLVRRLHELLWYLDAASRLPGTADLQTQIATATAEVEAVTLLPAAELAVVDVDARFDAARPLLLAASAAARSGFAATRLGPDLLGAKLAGADLRGHDLRGAVLIAADLSGADLRWADFIGADLRDANLSGADLSTAIYLTRVQVASARGDAATRLPAGLSAPAHWA